MRGKACEIYTFSEKVYLIELIPIPSYVVVYPDKDMGVVIEGRAFNRRKFLLFQNHINEFHGTLKIVCAFEITVFLTVIVYPSRNNLVYLKNKPIICDANVYFREA